MAWFRPLCAVGGLLGFAAGIPEVSAQDPFATSARVMTVSARSEYPASIQQTGDATDFAAGAAGATTGYLQYEPQNVPIGAEPPPLVSEFPPAAPYAEDQLARPLPPIVPYSTQFQFTWNSGSGDDLGIVDLDVREVFVFPKIPGLMLTPGFATHLLEGPTSTDLPGALYDNWLELRWLKKFNDCWTMDLAISPSLFTDYDNTSDGAFRLMGRAISLYSYSPDLQLAFGFIYLDREDIKALPAAGLIWTPNDDYKLELLFPRPRLMYRWTGDELCSRWVYVGGEFGGGSWAIQRPGPAPGQTFDDVITYGALRFLVGVETKRVKGFSPRVEAGFTFNRSIEYKSGNGDYDPGNAALLRFGGSF
jgi:hypothetical protein